MHLTAGRLRQLVTDARGSEGYIICHETLPMWRPGARPAVCRGFHDRYDTQALQVIRRLWGFLEVDPPAGDATAAVNPDSAPAGAAAAAGVTGAGQQQPAHVDGALGGRQVGVVVAGDAGQVHGAGERDAEQAGEDQAGQGAGDRDGGVHADPVGQVQGGEHDLRRRPGGVR